MKIVEIMKWIILVSLFLVGGMVKAQHLPQWLEKAVVYQIYPASFKDSDGDGIGDLKGIESQLDYIKSIGVNTIWISPGFSSEFFDGGYDVTDFYSVDKRYGTNSQLVSLVQKIHEKGMKIFMDLVAGHTSDKHPWFLQSKQADKNLQYSDYFIWTPTKAEKPKQFVATDCERDGNYMKNFFDCQPALNYGYANPNPEHPWEQSVDAPGPQAVRRELKNIISFWMDKGMDGFRVDMAYSLIKNDPKHIETSRLALGSKKNIRRELLLPNGANRPILLAADFISIFCSISDGKGILLSSSTRKKRKISIVISDWKKQDRLSSL